jgi:hypothetical protein
MTAERNLRPSFSVNVRRREEVFHAAFDAFCLRWNLYGMQHDKPLLLKLAVNLTPYGTMIHIPAYWSFDPKRDIRWDAIASLHRVRVPGRQGSALAEGLVERMQALGAGHQPQTHQPAPGGIQEPAVSGKIEVAADVRRLQFSFCLLRFK